VGIFTTVSSLLLTEVSSYVDQLNQILQILGTPSEETMARIGSPKVALSDLLLSQRLILIRDRLKDIFARFR
jgi:hypothetical protein